MPGPIICTNCETEHPAGAVDCCECGWPLNPDPRPVRLQPPSRDPACLRPLPHMGLPPVDRPR